MTISKHIFVTLNHLDTLYNESSSQNKDIEPTYYSKLAVLEYCGWIEESLDLIVKRSFTDKITNSQLIKIIEEKIKFNSGFQYENNLRPMLITSFGVIGTEKFENLINSNGNLDILKSELNALKEDRNSAAHTWIQGTTRQYPAPSVLIGRLNKVHPIFNDFYLKIQGI